MIFIKISLNYMIVGDVLRGNAVADDFRIFNFLTESLIKSVRSQTKPEIQ